jgi:hypothetical protein
MSKPIGEIVGNIAAILYVKGIVNLEEFKEVIGEDNFNKLIKEVENNDSK